MVERAVRWWAFDNVWPVVMALLVGLAMSGLALSPETVRAASFPPPGPPLVVPVCLAWFGAFLMFIRLRLRRDTRAQRNFLAVLLLALGSSVIYLPLLFVPQLVAVGLGPPVQVGLWWFGISVFSSGVYVAVRAQLGAPGTPAARIPPASEASSHHA